MNAIANEISIQAQRDGTAGGSQGGGQASGVTSISRHVGLGGSKVLRRVSFSEDEVTAGEMDWSTKQGGKLNGQKVIMMLRS